MIFPLFSTVGETQSPSSGISYAPSINPSQAEALDRQWQVTRINAAVQLAFSQHEEESSSDELTHATQRRISPSAHAKAQ